MIRKRPSYSTSGRWGMYCSGRHPWFGPIWFGGYRGFSTFVSTPDLRHALVQYRRLPIKYRQLDGPDPITGDRVCLAWGNQQRPIKR